MTSEQKSAVVAYLQASSSHTTTENRLKGNKLLSMTNVFESIKELRKHFNTKQIDHIIINRDELAVQLLK